MGTDYTHLRLCNDVACDSFLNIGGMEVSVRYWSPVVSVQGTRELGGVHPIDEVNLVCAGHDRLLEYHPEHVLSAGRHRQRPLVGRLAEAFRHFGDERATQDLEHGSFACVYLCLCLVFLLEHIDLVFFVFRQLVEHRFQEPVLLTSLDHSADHQLLGDAHGGQSGTHLGVVQVEFVLELHLHRPVLQVDRVFGGTLDVNLHHFEGEGAVRVLWRVHHRHGQRSVLLGRQPEMVLGDADAQFRCWAFDPEPDGEASIWLLILLDDAGDVYG